MATSDCFATGLIYDPLMTKHKNEYNPNHPETPERIVEAWHVLEQRGLKQRCKIIKSREATEEEILRVHSQEHVTVLSYNVDQPQDRLNLLSTCYNSIFLNPHSFTAASLAAGCVTQLTEEVVTGRLKNGMALVRPPGHHAEQSKCMGFSLFNSVAIAAKHAIEKLGLQRILIVDWDIHHGNGIQHQFYEDKRVLYVSLHRFDNGEYFPCADDANFDYVGDGNGKGYNINVAWNGDSMGDVEYLLAFYHILLPVALEFDPELVLVSCGFDAGLGDHLGGYRVTPAGYAHMTHLLMGVAQGKLVLALEGGYSLSCIRESTCAIVSVLLGDTLLPELEVDTPSESAIRSICSTGLTHSQYWKSLGVFSSTTGSGVQSAGLAKSITPESGKLPAEALFGRERPSNNLSEVLTKFKIPMDQSSHSMQNHEEELHSASSQDQKSHDQKDKFQQGSYDPTHDHSLPDEGSSRDQDQRSSQDQGDATMGSGPAISSPSEQQSVNPGITLVQKNIVQSLENEGHSAMFAVTPLSWCEHLSTHVQPLPPGGIDSTQPCEVCGVTQEPWVCLSCYHVFCGRYVNQHMVVHADSTGHKMSLSLADLSVWCYLCDSYIDNHVLRPAINSAHLSKFGTNIDGTQ